MQLGCQFSHLTGELFYFVLLKQNSTTVSKLMLAPRHFLTHWARYWKVKEIPHSTISLSNCSWSCFLQHFHVVPVVLDCQSLQLLFHLHLVPIVLIATVVAEKHGFPLLTCLQPYWDLLHGLFPGTAASRVFWIVFSLTKLFSANPGGTWSYLHLMCLRVTVENIYQILWWSWGGEQLQRKGRILCLLWLSFTVLSGTVWNRHDSSLVVHGQGISLRIIKLESLGSLFVRLIFHPSSSSLSEDVPVYPITVLHCSNSREGAFQERCCTIHSAFSYWFEEKKQGWSVRGSMQWDTVLGILPAPAGQRNLRGRKL